MQVSVCRLKPYIEIQKQTVEKHVEKRGDKNKMPSCVLNYHNLKIRRTLMHDIRKHWTAISTLLGLISSVYRDLHHWRSNQQPQIAEPKTLQLSQQSISHTSDAKLTSHGNCAAN